MSPERQLVSPSSSVARSCFLSVNPMSHEQKNEEHARNHPNANARLHHELIPAITCRLHDARYNRIVVFQYASGAGLVSLLGVAGVDSGL